MFACETKTFEQRQILVTRGAKYGKMQKKVYHLVWLTINLATAYSWK